MQRLCAQLVLLVGLTTGALGALAEPGPAGRASGPHKASITRGLDCSACHTTKSWDLLGGVPSGESGFDHARTGFPLSGRHRHAACTDCHTGERKVTRDCNGCHHDAHQRRLGQACDSCHSSRGWQGVDAIARHRLTRLPLTGMHALADCSECHRRTTERERSVPADCFACHAQDYRSPNVHPRHTGVPGDPSQAPFPRDCAQCHRPTGWSPAVISKSASFALGQGLTSRRAHDVRFPISFGKHRSAGCGGCHESLSRPRIVRCDGCHAHSAARIKRQHRRVHGAQGSCLGCHPGGARR